MENKVKVFLILVGIIAVILGIILSNKTEYNVFYDKYDDSNYYQLEISETKMNRYNEKLNNATIGYLVANLDILMNENNQIYNRGIIEYAMFWAERYDYRFKENTKKVDNVEYVNIKYLNTLIKELFNVDIDISKEGFNIVDEYVELNTIMNLITAAFSLKLEKVLYNEKEDIYIAYIFFSNVEYDEETITNDINVPADDRIVIRYKKNSKGINTILQYEKISI